MAVYPGGKYRPLNQFSNVGTRPRLGVVLHVNDSDGPSLYNWIAGNNDMSCHFQVAKDGTVEQYVDTDNGSWCQMDGNDTYLSIETQGFPSEPLTDAQVEACARLYRWLHDTHGILYRLAEAPGQRGFGWHGMGGAAWGGHTGCPGDARRSQRSRILALASGADQELTLQADVAARFDAIEKKVDDLTEAQTGRFRYKYPNGVEVSGTLPGIVGDLLARRSSPKAIAAEVVGELKQAGQAGGLSVDDVEQAVANVLDGLTLKASA